MRLANIFSDGMVLQQNQSINIWGYANSGDVVCINVTKDSDKNEIRSVQTTADVNGFFMALLEPVKGSFNTYTLSCVCNNDEVVVSDILFGEVWLTCGQSNMIFNVYGCHGAEELMKNANYPYIRFASSYPFPEGKDLSMERPAYPQGIFPYNGWKKADYKDNVASFSYISYAFALKLFNTLNIPIGIIMTAVGGTNIDAWLHREDIENDNFLKEYLKSVSRYLELNEINTKKELNYTQMSVLYNEKIAPLHNLSIKGTLWYQGESNIVGQSQEEETKYYKHALKTLIDGWNRRFNNPSQFFIISHIAYFNYCFSPFGVAQMNEAIDDVCRECGSFVMQTPIYDIPLDWKILGNIYSDPIHPVVKAPVGERMAFAALQNVYGIGNCFAVPYIKEAVKVGNKFIFTFNDTGEGLKITKGSTLRGFTICSQNGVHLEANAIITGKNTVEAYNTCIKEPVGATYAYSCINVESNLSSSYGMPAVPFRLNRQNEIYYCPNPWMNCDSLFAWSDHTRWYMGGAEFKPIWIPGMISGTKEIRISLDQEIKSEGDSSIRIDYVPNEDTGNFIGISPVINLVGRHHQLNKFDYLTFDVHNPDDREKTFMGIVMISANGMIYSAGVEQEGVYKDSIAIAGKSDFATCRVPLRKIFGGAFQSDGNSHNTLENIVTLQFTFSDNKKGTLYIDNIRGCLE